MDDDGKDMALPADKLIWSYVESEEPEMEEDDDNEEAKAVELEAAEEGHGESAEAAKHDEDPHHCLFVSECS